MIRNAEMFVFAGCGIHHGLSNAQDPQNRLHATVVFKTTSILFLGSCLSFLDRRGRKLGLMCSANREQESGNRYCKTMRKVHGSELLETNGRELIVVIVVLVGHHSCKNKNPFSVFSNRNPPDAMAMFVHSYILGRSCVS